MSVKTSKSRSGSKLIIAAAILVLLVAVGLYYLRPVAQVVIVHRGKAIDARPGSVTVQAEKSEFITSDVGGRVLESGLEEGREVKEGDFLLQLDPSELTLEIQALQNDYDTLKATIAVGSQLKLQLDTANADLDNYRRMFKLGQVSKVDLDNKERTAESLDQQVKQESVSNESKLKYDENQIAEKKLQLEHMRITAPWNGVITDVLAQKGAVVAGNATLATLISTSRIVTAQISEEDFGGIVPGMKANIRFLTYGDQLYGANVTKVLPKADPTTQRYIIYLDVDKRALPAAKLTPGLTGEVTVDVKVHDHALLMPHRAVLGDQVFVIDGGRVEAREVKLGFQSLTDVEVVSGVSEGDAVIAEDLDRFTPGDRVRVEILPK
jgi:RND family efflux transporter MFP subunit